MARPIVALVAFLLAGPALAQIPAGVYREDTPHSSGEHIYLVAGVRNDAGVSLCGANGDRCVISLDADGNVRIVGSVSVSGTVTITGALTDAQLRAADVPTATSTVVVSGTVDALDETVQVVLDGRTACAFQVTTSNLIASATIEVSFDGSTWVQVDTALTIDDGTTGLAANLIGITSATRRIVGFMPPAASHARLRLAAYTSGTATVIARASSFAGTYVTPLGNTGGVGGAFTVGVETELTTGGSLNETMSNPTPALVGAFNMLWNGSSWDRWRGSASSGARVEVMTSTLPTGASTSAEQVTQTASLGVMDDWDEADRAKVNPIVGQAGVAANAGDLSATTQRFVEAGNPTLTVGQITCATTATQIAAARAGRKGIEVTMLGTGDAYLGASGVTTAAGHLLLGTKGTSKSLPSSAAVYCIVASGTQAVSYVEVY